jgi:L-threonylcarbamoyladenylate synthase
MCEAIKPMSINPSRGTDLPLNHTPVASIHDPAARTLALDLLAAAQVIGAPTDTVYGLMCRFDSAAGIEQLYIVKDRPPHKAIPVLLADADQLAVIVAGGLSAQAQQLIDRFWPGPLTLILPALPTLLDILTAGQPTIGVRVPGHAELRSLLRTTGPLAATSANRSGAPDTATAAEVLAQFDGRIPLILADDEVIDRHKPRVPSTIVDLTGTLPRIVRPGPIADAVTAVLGVSC